ncbi:MAG: hypothetical protein KJO82_09235 [Gammaproteobacteria bacterium]|nr:hypothetical protein [Gammaproteobacteria bacterium]
MKQTSLLVSMVGGWLLVSAVACDAQTNLQVTREDVDDLFHASELFKENGMDLNVATVSRVLRDETETLVWLSAMFDGLPVFYHEHGYLFDSGRTLSRKPGSDEPMILGEPLPSADAFPLERKAITAVDDAIDAWLERVRAVPQFSDQLQPNDKPEVTLGFHNTNLGTDKVSRFKLVWRVRANGGRKPEAMVGAIDGNVLFFDSGIRTSRPIPPRPPTNPAAASRTFSPVDAWTSGGCSDRKYRREIRLSSDNTFSATDYVAPCPPDMTCVWSGIVHHSGTWEIRNERLIELDPASTQNSQGAALATALHVDLATDRLVEATPGSVMNCFYDRDESSNSGGTQ